MRAPAKRRVAAVSGLVWTLGVALAVCAASRTQARRVETLSTDEIRAGMKGHAVSVLKGQTPDRFEIEIVDVVKNYLPRQDAILFTSPDPRMLHTGVVGGMSGSPVYVDGKLIGAIAYGYRFNKDPIGGITPIENMLEVGRLPHRPDVLARPRGRVREGTSGWADAMLGLGTSPLPPRRRPEDASPSTGLVPLGLPMSVSGLGGAATRLLSETVGLLPTRGGGGRSDGKGGKRRFRPGDSVSVVLISGDNWAAPNGTVTWVGPRGKRLVAFGHPMFNDGPTNIPIADARIHTIIPSVERSVKISSPGAIQGTMVQDRQAGIAGRMDLTAPMIPVTTTLVSAEPDLARRTYTNEIAVGFDVTPGMAGVLLAEAVSEAGQDAAELVLTLEHEYDVETSRGSRTIKLAEEAFFPHGAAASGVSRSRGVLVIAAMLENDFEVARIRAIRQRVTMEYGAPSETIEEVEVAADEVHANDVVDLRVKLRAYRGETRIETVPLRIPADAGGEKVQISVTGGNFVRPYRPIPSCLDDLLDTLEIWYPARSLIVSIYREQEGLSTRHGLLRELPDSMLESLSGAGGTRKPVRFKQLARRVLSTKTLIEGEHDITLDVLTRKKF